MRPASLQGLPVGSRSALFWSAATAGVVAAAMALQAFLQLNADTSWLLYVAERTLGGAVPYRDIFETNPPASFLIYVPAVLLARGLGTSPECMTGALIILGAAASLALSAAILVRARVVDPSCRPALAFAASVVLLILPVSSFAQREHIAVLATLPALAAMVARRSGSHPSWPLALLAGLGAGLALAIKPVFILGFLGPALYCFDTHAWRAAARMPEILAAGTLASIYGLAIFVFYPEFGTHVLPLVAAIYVPARLDAITLLALPILWIWAAMALHVVTAGSRRDALATVLVLASVGFAAAVLIQGKGFTYHGYPAVALATLAAGLSLLRVTQAAPRALARLGVTDAAATAVFLGSLVVFTEYARPDTEAPGLTRAIAAITPHPRMLTISANMFLGRSFARGVGGEWAASSPIAWITCYAVAQHAKPEDDPLFAAAIRMERDRYAADIDRNRPDVVLVDGDGWMRWTRHSPALVQALSHYEPAGRYGDILLLRREHAAASGAEPGQPDAILEGATRS